MLAVMTCLQLWQLLAPSTLLCSAAIFANATITFDDITWQSVVEPVNGTYPQEVRTESRGDYLAAL